MSLSVRVFKITASVCMYCILIQLISQHQHRHKHKHLYHSKNKQNSHLASSFRYFYCDAKIYYNEHIYFGVSPTIRNRRTNNKSNENHVNHYHQMEQKIAFIHPNVLRSYCTNTSFCNNNKKNKFRMQKNQRRKHFSSHTNNNIRRHSNVFYARMNTNDEQQVDDEDPFFLDEADELFYYMNMFQEEETMGDNFDNTATTTTNNNNQNDILKKNNLQSDNHDDFSNNVKDDIEKLIIPDLSTLLSSAIIDSTSSDTYSTVNNSTNNIPISSSISHIEQLAPAESIAYFYLQNTIGLSQHTMWKITNEVGSVLGFTTQNLKQKISFLQRMMNLSHEEIQIMLTKQPSILHLSSNRNISQKVLFLVRSLDLSKDELKEMVLAYPCILCYAIPNLQKKLGFFQFILNIEQEDDNDQKVDNNSASMAKMELRNLLVQHPKLLIAAVDDSNYNYDDNNGYDDYDDDDFNIKNGNVNDVRIGSGGLIAKYQFLNEEIGLSRDDLKIIIKKNPSILLYSLQNNLQPKLISLFIMRLRMNSEQISKVLKSFPQVLDYNMDNYLLPTTHYFLTELGFSPMEFRSIVLKFPKVYSYSLFKIKHVVGYFRYQLGMNASQVKRILFQAPQVISLNTDETLVSKVEFMRESFGFAQSTSGLGDIRKVIAGMPTLLLCSVDKNLRPKVQYLLEQFNGDHLELRQAVLTLPTLFGYSLEKRIKPRMEQIVEVGMEPIKVTVGITMTETNFMKWLTNQKHKIQNRNMSVSRQGIMYNSDRQNFENGEFSDDVESLGAIVLWKNSDEDDSTHGTGRIMHWKR